MNKEIYPIGNTVLAEPFPEQRETKGGILLTNTINKEKVRMRVLRVGEGTEDKPMYLKNGDVIYKRKRAGVQMEQKGQTVYVIDVDHIIAYER